MPNFTAISLSVYPRATSLTIDSSRPVKAKSRSTLNVRSTMVLSVRISVSAPSFRMFSRIAVFAILQIMVRPALDREFGVTRAALPPPSFVGIAHIAP